MPRHFLQVKQAGLFPSRCPSVFWVVLLMCLQVSCLSSPRWPQLLGVHTVKFPEYRGWGVGRREDGTGPQGTVVTNGGCHLGSWRMGMASWVRMEVKVWKELTSSFSKDITTVTLAMSSAGMCKMEGWTWDVQEQKTRHGDSEVPGNESPQASQKKSPQSSNKPWLPGEGGMITACWGGGRSQSGVRKASYGRALVPPPWQGASICLSARSPGLCPGADLWLPLFMGSGRTVHSLICFLNRLWRLSG